MGSSLRLYDLPLKLYELNFTHTSTPYALRPKFLRLTPLTLCFTPHTISSLF
jgi:hypothetical protein